MKRIPRHWQLAKLTRQDFCQSNVTATNKNFSYYADSTYLHLKSEDIYSLGIKPHCHDIECDQKLLSPSQQIIKSSLPAIIFNPSNKSDSTKKVAAADLARTKNLRAAPFDA